MSRQITVFNHNQFDHRSQTMFFGENNLNLQRYDDVKYPIFEKSTNTQLGFFWRPEEVSLLKDRNDYQRLNDGQRAIFDENLQRQMVADSENARGPNIAFLPYATLPEVEAAIISWGFMETVHSRSYQHMVRNIYSDPSKIFDDVLKNEKIAQCAKDIAVHYDNFINYAMRFYLNGDGDELELRRLFYLSMVNVNALEAIRFYVSFACNFCFAENKSMEGSAKIMSLIARDEAQHVALTQNILTRLPDDDPLFAQVIADKNVKEQAVEIYRYTVLQEQDWAQYLFSKGSMIGLSAPILKQYIEHIAAKRMSSIHLPSIYSKTENPLTWMDNWLSTKKLQNAPQETEITSYRVGGIKMDITPDTFKDFVL